MHTGNKNQQVFVSTFTRFEQTWHKNQQVLRYIDWTILCNRVWSTHAVFTSTLPFVLSSANFWLWNFDVALRHTWNVLCRNCVRNRCFTLLLRIYHILWQRGKIDLIVDYGTSFLPRYLQTSFLLIGSIPLAPSSRKTKLRKVRQTKIVRGSRWKSAAFCRSIQLLDTVPYLPPSISSMFFCRLISFSPSPLLGMSPLQLFALATTRSRKTRERVGSEGTGRGREWICTRGRAKLCGKGHRRGVECFRSRLVHFSAGISGKSCR